MIYLDTSIIIWLYRGEKDFFSPKAKALLENNEFIISPIVTLELSYLHEIGRILVPSHEVIETMRENIDLKICNKSFHLVIEKATQYTWTRDPFDRIITAQAALDSSILLTKDRTILTHYNNAAW